MPLNSHFKMINLTLYRQFKKGEGKGMPPVTAQPRVSAVNMLVPVLCIHTQGP